MAPSSAPSSGVKIVARKASQAKSSSGGGSGKLRSDMGAVGEAVSNLQGAGSGIGGAGNDAVPTCERTTIAVAANAKGAHDDAKTTAGNYRGALSADANAIASLGRALRAEDQALAGNG